MMWHMWDITSGMSWWWVFGGFWVLLFWGGLVALIVWAVKKLTERGGTVLKSAPLAVVKERYAKGEITREEFEQIRRDLS